MGTAITLANVFQVLWYIGMLFVPFLIVNILRKAKHTKKNSDQILKIMLAQANEAKLSQEILARMYGIQGNQLLGFFYNNKSYKNFNAAIAAAMSTAS